MGCFCRVHSTNSREPNGSQAAELSHSRLPRMLCRGFSAEGAVSSFSQGVQQSPATCWPFQQWSWSLGQTPDIRFLPTCSLNITVSSTVPHVLPISVPSTPAHGNMTTCAQQSCCRHIWTCFLQGTDTSDLSLRGHNVCTSSWCPGPDVGGDPSGQLLSCCREISAQWTHFDFDLWGIVELGVSQTMWHRFLPITSPSFVSPSEIWCLVSLLSLMGLFYTGVFLMALFHLYCFFSVTNDVIKYDN